MALIAPEKSMQLFTWALPQGKKPLFPIADPTQAVPGSECTACRFYAARMNTSTGQQNHTKSTEVGDKHPLLHLGTHQTFESMEFVLLGKLLLW